MTWWLIYAFVYVPLWLMWQGLLLFVFVFLWIINAVLRRVVT